MTALNTSKTLEKFRRNEMWKATKAVCNNNSFSVTLSLTSLPYEKASSPAITPTTNRNHAESSISTLDLESDSDEEIVSGAAQTHQVFNLAQLGHAMDDAYESHHHSISLSFDSM